MKGGEKGQSWQTVKDEKGNPVKTVGDEIIKMYCDSCGGELELRPFLSSDVFSVLPCSNLRCLQSKGAK